LSRGAEEAVLGEGRIRPRDECQDIGTEDRLPVLNRAGLVTDEQIRGRCLPGPRGNGSDQAGGQGKPAGQVPQPLRGQQVVIERHPVEHLIEQSRIAAPDPDGEKNESLGIDCPSIGSFNGR
jgi:hypothetical protein